MTTDMHAFDDCLQAVEDLVQVAADYKAGKKPGLLVAWKLLSDLKDIGADLPDFKDEATKASVVDWSALGSRAAAIVVSIAKLVA